jgi:hypothetical protein
VVVLIILPQAKNPSSLPAGRQAGFKNRIFQKHVKSYPQTDKQINVTKK